MQRDWIILHEVWRPVPGFPSYEASSWGNVRRVKRAKGATVGAVLKPSLDRQGYEQLRLSENGVVRSQKVHIIVASAFHGPRPKGLEVSHVNGRRIDNRPENLAYETRQQNVDRQIEHGTRNRGEKNGNASLTPDLVARARILLRDEVPVRMISETLGTSQSTIYHLRAGNSWRHLQEHA